LGYVDLNQNKRTDYVTPEVCRALLRKLGPLKLDVCTTARNPMQAEQIYTPAINGLAQSWVCGGLAYCNWPWSRTESPKWVDKAYREGEKIKLCTDMSELVLLGPSRSDTDWFRKLFTSSSAMYFWKGRMTFEDPETMEPIKTWSKKLQAYVEMPVPVPTQLSYWGPRTDLFIKVFSEQGGVYVDLRK
jgi:hypothetical protein